MHHKRAMHGSVFLLNKRGDRLLISRISHPPKAGIHADANGCLASGAPVHWPLLRCFSWLGLIAQPRHRQQWQHENVAYIITYDHECSLWRQENIVPVRNPVLVAIRHLQSEGQVTFDRRLNLTSVHIGRTYAFGAFSPRLCYLLFYSKLEWSDQPVAWRVGR